MGRVRCIYLHLDGSKNSGTPKSSILIGFSIINHPFLGTIIFGNTQLFFCGKLINVGKYTRPVPMDLSEKKGKEST